eukprot:gb/GECG01003218.1/.p1 GENE.gb/GECG01003218.1/~~gb/GECG01003218.1/.p1  ORF type:complete len:136 (+),score=5.66 gb/GECG01003218.1/:1-408(+)
MTTPQLHLEQMDCRLTDDIYLSTPHKHALDNTNKLSDPVLQVCRGWFMLQPTAATLDALGAYTEEHQEISIYPYDNIHDSPYPRGVFIFHASNHGRLTDSMELYQHDSLRMENPCHCIVSPRAIVLVHTAAVAPS